MTVHGVPGERQPEGGGVPRENGAPPSGRCRGEALDKEDGMEREARAHLAAARDRSLAELGGAAAPRALRALMTKGSVGPRPIRRIVSTHAGRLSVAVVASPAAEGDR
jgi:hypothetical protein